MANVATNVISGRIECNGSDTTYALNSSTLITAANCVVSGGAPLTAQGPNQGWNQLTVTVTGLSGGKTWVTQGYINNQAVALTDDLPNGAVVTVGGPQPGAFSVTGGNPTFTGIPSFRSPLYNVVLSAADSSGVIHFTLESRSL